MPALQVTVKAFTVVPTRSGVLRAVSEREVLDLFNARLAAISLSGFIFFGSSVKISDQVHGSCMTIHSHAETLLPQEGCCRVGKSLMSYSIGC